MNTELLKVALRQNAIYLTSNNTVILPQLQETTMTLVANCARLGFSFSEDALKRINTLSPIHKMAILDVLKEVTGVQKNWTPLTRQWDIPTGESFIDHAMTWFANVMGSTKGTRLECGHLIPHGTFQLERYNGCPFCGTPFRNDSLDLSDTSANQLKELVLWTEKDAQEYLKGLLESPIALDATKTDSLKTLIKHLGLPTNVEVKMKETLMLVIDALIEANKTKEAGRLFKTPTDILRYIWYKNTGYLQIVEPKTILKQIARNYTHMHSASFEQLNQVVSAKEDLKLKFSRTECKMYATWLNNLKMPIEAQCANMHSKRGIWVRVIRALRLAEYSKKEGFEQLREMLDVFYNEVYDVWEGRLNHFKLKMDADNTFALLKQRPGLFARSLFSSMLWFGKDTTLAHFKEVIHKVPTRLIYSLNMYADVYFDKSASRSIKTLGGTRKRISTNRFLQLYDETMIEEMKSSVRDLTMDVIKAKFVHTKNTNETMYIDEYLYKVPFEIGDRSETIQDLPSAAMGTRFALEGSKVRLFMQWGVGLPAQRLDMDLSARVAYKDRSDHCSYSQLVIAGCKHSGDIINIPHKVGAAEYIDLDLDVLETLGARYVSFTCNAYSQGSISPNLVVGWMNSKHPMKVTKSGVAYNPAHVQHQVRVTQGTSKGLVFGVLDVQNREIIWLEMNFAGQVVQGLDVEGVESLLQKLEAKIKLGDMLRLKAEVQGLTIVEDPSEADEVYDKQWAISPEVNQLFLDN